ncbi:alpha/beta hydrolase [Planktotalea sp.]|uniref:alpha/beta hydrolase family protein n=1 Tax=Planktotalea sp. TaxID=2029877 RepID=UPI00329A6689
MIVGDGTERNQLKLWALLASSLIVLAFIGFILWRLTDHDLDRRADERLHFVVDGYSISGTIWLPDKAPNAVVAFVYGDGAQDRTSSGGYAPMINAFLDKGIAVAAWDKPGVGQSKGNWLLQSMADRTAETRAALQVLKHRFEGIVIGAIGFSQAGWVLPALTPEDADFLVLVGPAVSWQDQGDYYARTRLAMDGFDTETINEMITAQNQEDERIFGKDAKESDAPSNMSRDRWGFNQRNRTADARQALSTLELPLLAIWGADDLNVDAVRNAEIYLEALARRNEATQIIVWPEATHGLLKARSYNWQLTKDWSWFAIMRFLAEGRYAYSPGTINAIAIWVLGVTQD